jgi:hypothetical protein
VLVEAQAPGHEARIGKRMKQIVAQEQHQRHVPALPEILDAGGAHRCVEVERQLHAEQQAEADGDVRIAGEIEQHLERKAEREP